MYYYVNTQAQTNGDHEVHNSSCSFLPLPQNRLYLGDFDGCWKAVVEARKHYAKSNGCFFCSNACHTS